MRFCLRCDWEGEGKGDRCPSCGAPLYEKAVGSGPGSRPAPPTARPAAPGERSARVESRPIGEEGRESQPARRNRPLAALALVFLLAIAATSWFFHTFTRTVPAAGSAPRPGRLVYAVNTAPGSARLWIWNLATGDIKEGPAVTTPVDLVNASGAQPGWVGITSRLPDGTYQASVLRFLGKNDVADALLSGNLIAWGPRGQSVVSVQRGLVSGCRRDVRITRVDVLPRERDVEYHDPRLCGDVLSVGRDGIQTYFTLVQKGHVAVDVAGYRLVEPVLSGFALLSVSPASDMIVARASDMMASPAGQGGEPPVGVSGVALSFRRSGGLGPMPYGPPGHRFVVDRVLAWSPDSSNAIVDGELGGRRGLFVLGTVSNPASRAPTFLGAVRGDAWATYADNGTPYVGMDGKIYLVAADGLQEMRLPAGAPAPSGPITWLS